MYALLLLTLVQVYFGLTSAACGGNFTNEFNGTITSPGYPNNYDFGLECVWEIKVAAGSKISVTINDLDIESTGGGDTGCGTNQVSFDEPSPQVETKVYCNQARPQGAVTSSANELTVKFESPKNETIRSKGFSAVFTTIPPPTTATTTTTTIAPNTTTAAPTNATTQASTNAPVTKPPPSGLSKGVVAAICIIVILVVLLIIDLILYQKEMGVIFTIRKSCCGGYAAVST